MIILQIGTNKGYDDITKYVFNYKDILEKFIAIEPLVVHNISINECYKEIPQLIIENVAIVPRVVSPTMTFYYHQDDGPGFEVASSDKNHILKHQIYNSKLTEEGIIECTIPCMTINDMFEKHNLTKIDILYIDAEGMDFEIIKSIDFKYDIVNIIYEHLHIDGEAAIKFLENKGYTTSRNFGHNGWSHAAIKQ